MYDTKDMIWQKSDKWQDAFMNCYLKKGICRDSLQNWSERIPCLSHIPIYTLLHNKWHQSLLFFYYLIRSSIIEKTINYEDSQNDQRKQTTTYFSEKDNKSQTSLLLNWDRHDQID